MSTEPQDPANPADSALNTEAAAPGSDLARLQAELAEAKEKTLRVAADAENLRRRLERERDDAVKFAASKFARDVLSVADNLGRALQSAPKTAAPDSNDPLHNLITGVEATERELLSVFERHGIQRIDPQGQKFDPNLHQAMFEVENPQIESGLVVQVVAAGYVQHGRLLRAAMVGVSKGGPAAPAGGSVNTQA